MSYFCSNSSIDPAIIPKTENKKHVGLLVLLVLKLAQLSNLVFATCFSTLGFILANVPTAPEIAQVDTS